MHSIPSMMAEKSWLVMIGGMPRSGTTLLARVVSENLGIPFSPETHYFTYAYRDGALSPEQLPKEILAESRVAAAYRCIEGQPRSVQTFRTLLRKSLGVSHVLGEKTPAHLTAFADILSQDENVICVVILRDFFEITESLKKVYWNTASFRSNLKRCARYHRTAFRTQRRFPDRVIMLDYQDLCKNEEAVVAALSARLPHGRCTETQRFFDPELEPWKQDALRAPEARSRKVPFRRIPEWVLARVVHLTCKVLWPVKQIKV